jgi:hypothetical protein
MIFQLRCLVLEGVVVAAVIVVGATTAEIVALRVHALLAKSIDGLLQLYLCCSLFLDLLLHELSSLHNRPSSSRLLLYKSKAFILFMKARQLVFYGCFNFILGVLILIF